MVCLGGVGVSVIFAVVLESIHWSLLDEFGHMAGAFLRFSKLDGVEDGRCWLIGSQRNDERNKRDSMLFASQSFAIVS